MVDEFLESGGRGVVATCKSLDIVGDRLIFAPEYEMDLSRRKIGIASFGCGVYTLVHIPEGHVAVGFECRCFGNSKIASDERGLSLR